MAGLAPTILVIASLVVLLGGFVKGLAGFGYALVSTTLLATFLQPSTAVVLMIVPLLAASLSLVRELESGEVRTCLSRFWPYLLAASIGTAVGMVLIEFLPTDVMLLGLGVFTLLYVTGKQPYVRIPGEAWLRQQCFKTSNPTMTGLGFTSGLVFGASNVAVQVVAYLDSLSLSRNTFVGVLAMILVGISSLRIGLAWTLGMYESGGLLVVSVGLAIPGLIGVTLGQRLRTILPEFIEVAGVLVLLTVIGVRLVTSGAESL